ncbi:MAG: Gfo/Idh/MocA family oxidoreductase [Verrucomicrobiia bacterium]
MKENKNSGQFENPEIISRRNFLQGTSIAALMAMLGGIELKPAEQAQQTAQPQEAAKKGNPVNCALIGCGVWGREILTTLSQIPTAPVVAICDNYEPMLNRSKKLAPNAEPFTDYKKLLEKKEVQAVIVATPTHLHKDIVIDALKAGKHVYCEAPLANTVEDAQAIAKAAHEAVKVNFQAGLQLRSDKQRHFLLQFIRSGAAGTPIKARAQWHKKESWARVSPNPDRQKDTNWRLYKDTSTGLIGEIGIHQIDELLWFMLAKPKSVTGFGGILFHKDDREIADTAQAIFQFGTGMTLNYEATLGNSFDSDYEMLYGSDAAIMVRGPKAWMFKEADAPLLGWEVYAKKEEFYKESGIVLRADATKIIAHTEGASKDSSGPTPLYQALDAFVYNCDMIASAVEDFSSSFNVKDTEALRKYLNEELKNKALAATAEDGLIATVYAIKANEAVEKGTKIEFQKDWFKI